MSNRQRTNPLHAATGRTQIDRYNLSFTASSLRPEYDDSTAFLREESANFLDVPAADVQPLRALAESPHPFRGGIVPAAKTAVTNLRGYITGMLKTERDRAVTELEDYAARLQTTEDFKLLDEASRSQVLALSHEAVASIQSARFVTGIRDRLHRYTAKDYPAQLALASRLAADSREPASGAPTGSAPAPVQYTPASSLRPKCSLNYISNESDLDQWLDALRAAAKVELDKGNRISL